MQRKDAPGAKKSEIGDENILQVNFDKMFVSKKKKKKKHLCEEGKFSFVNLPTKIKSLKLLSVRYFFC